MKSSQNPGNGSNQVWNCQKYFRYNAIKNWNSLSTRINVFSHHSGLNKLKKNIAFPIACNLILNVLFLKKNKQNKQTFGLQWK